jgi:hypothetical protein
MADPSSPREVEIARMEYQDAFTRYMAAADRERERENREAQEAAERRAMDTAAASNRQTTHIKWATIAMVAVAAAQLLQTWCHASGR